MPKPEQVQKAVEQIRKRGANYEYFFAKLSSPDWIAPLAEKGLFSSPPPAVRQGDGISFSFWPESRYLARMAALAPEVVLAVMEAIPETDNVRVHEDFCEAAAAMPGRQAAEWARREAAWIESQHHLYFLPGHLAELIEHLSAAGEHDAALQLARAVLRIRRAPDGNSPTALFDSWDYDQVLQKCLPSILAARPMQTLTLLCDLLVNTLTAEADQPTPPEDYSWIWRPAIEDHEQNHEYYDLREMLIRSIRDGAGHLVAANTIAVTDVLSEFDRREWYVFQRLGLHLLADCINLARNEARSRVLSKKFFDTIQIHHEYVRLLQVVFPELDAPEQEEVLGWIDSPPVVADDPPTARDHRVLQRLVLLDGKLPLKWQSKLDALRGQFGQPHHPGFHSYTTSWVGPTSPLNLPDLEAMAPGEVAEYCRNWSPADEWQSPSREGLARTLQKDVARRAAEYVKALSDFEETDVTYVRNIVHGLAEATKANTPIEWPPVVGLLEWIVKQERSIPGRSGKHLDEDPHWGWARKAVADIIGIACDRDVLPPVVRERVWKVLETLSGDPDPTPLDDQQATSDPANRSINTTRGEAMHAVVRFALWEYRAQGNEQQHARMADDVRTVLSQRLELAVEPSLAVRSVYGQWLPWLYMMDHEWVTDSLPRIFPESEEEEAVCQAAWNTYVTFCSPYDEVFGLLVRQYSAAVSRLGEGRQSSQESRHEGESLGEHLMLLAARGKVAWDDEGGVLRGFFEKAPTAVAEHALAFVGRVLRNDKHPVSEDVVHRFRVLWEKVRAEMMDRGSKNPLPLKAFGWWFSSGQFEQGWACRQLLDVVRSTGQIDPAFLVYEELENVASRDAALAVAILRELVRVDERGWQLLGSKDHLRAVLMAGLRSPETSGEARLAIHDLGARGHFEFRDLLGVQPEGNGMRG